jgi:cytochrome P450
VASKQFEKLSLPSHRRFARAAEKLDTEIRAMIAERREGACEDPDLLSVMVRLHRQSRKGITDRKIRDQMLTFFMVGNETTATALMWTWYLLTENPDVATKLYSEVDRVLGDQLPSGQDCDRLRYTRMVFAESMRLYPPVWIMTRRAVRDIKINGFLIRGRLYVRVSQFVRIATRDTFRSRNGSIPSAGRRKRPRRARGFPTFRLAEAACNLSAKALPGCKVC